VLLNGNLIGLRQATHYTFNEFVQELVSNTSVVSDVFLPLDELLVIALKLFQRHFVNFRQVVGVLFEIFLQVLKQVLFGSLGFVQVVAVDVRPLQYSAVL
jgi:hypothetical protein